MANFYIDLEDLHDREFMSWYPASDSITLDGNFTPEELRRIADCVEKIQSEESKK